MTPQEAAAALLAPVGLDVLRRLDAADGIEAPVALLCTPLTILGREWIRDAFGAVVLRACTGPLILIESAAKVPERFAEVDRPGVARMLAQARGRDGAILVPLDGQLQALPAGPPYKDPNVPEPHAT